MGVLHMEDVVRRGRGVLGLAGVALAVALAVGALGSAPRGADAHFTQSLFTYSNCDEGPTDPMNVIFYGRRAFSGRVAQQVERRMGWDGESGSTQYFKSHGQCIEQRGQRNLGFWDKHHLRFFSMPGRDRKGRKVVFSDAHRERKKFCGATKPISDAVYPDYHGRSGFDQGQLEVYAGFKKRYRGSLRGPGRMTFTQCTGERVGWNGQVLMFSIR
jgi:hypothetical protein